MDLAIKAWLPIIETALKVVIVFGGAVWTIFLLPYLRQRAKANAEIDNLHINTEKAQKEIKELDSKLLREVKVSVRIEADMLPSDEGEIIIATIAITNHGNEATRIKWADEPPAFTVCFVTFGSDGKAQHSCAWKFRVMSTRNPSNPARSHVIRAGTTENLAFAFQANRPGLYLLSFRGATDPDVREEAEKYGVKLPTAWTAQRYVPVGRMFPANLPSAPEPEAPGPLGSARSPAGLAADRAPPDERLRSPGSSPTG